MNLNDVLSKLDGVKGGNGQYTARCPAHDDHNSSLSIAEGDKGIVIHCHTGCDTMAVAQSIGLRMSDLFQDSTKTTALSICKTVATTRYEYRRADGTLAYIKERYDKENGSKVCAFYKPDGSKGVKGIMREPYNLPNIINCSYLVYFVEGEKCADILTKHDMVATTLDGGSNSVWHEHYNEYFKGKKIVVLPDHDQAGEKYALNIANRLYGIAGQVYILNLPGLKEKEDIYDWLKAGRTIKELAELTQSCPEYKPIAVDSQKGSPLLSCFKTLDEFEEEEATWLIPRWFPDGQITLMAADGGIGKTTLWCNIIAALSNGSSCILDPPEYERPPIRVAFMTTEDSVRKKLKRKLRLAGANMKNVISPDFLADKEGLLRNLKFGSHELSDFVKHFRPALCVFDPVQGFIPPDINMGSRNAMRDCMAPLISLGEECGTTFLVVCHTNKRKGAYGRDRIADSADLWDISRSVLMAGFTEEQKIRYLSNEKNNYSELQQTLLFSIDSSGQAQRAGASWKRDREYMQDSSVAKSAPKREDCKGFILHALDEAGGTLLSKELEEKAQEAGYSYKTLRSAKDELKKSNDIEYSQTGSKKNKTWHIQRVCEGGFVEVVEVDEPVQWGEQATLRSETHKRTNE